VQQLKTWTRSCAGMSVKARVPFISCIFNPFNAVAVRTVVVALQQTNTHRQAT